jgi:hypothetical protein
VLVLGGDEVTAPRYGDGGNGRNQRKCPEGKMAGSRRGMTKDEGDEKKAGE